jgi:two-component system cell cycle sensor histidine kinase/response regulator CckA
LVEDEPSIRGLIGEVLVHEGYRVIEARNGQEALALFDGTVDLLLIDMVLPYVSGQHVIDQLRGLRPTLKVLSISGSPSKAPKDPAIGFLAKPFSKLQLLQIVHAVMDGH